jgi:hypothetical protein
MNFIPDTLQHLLYLISVKFLKFSTEMSTTRILVLININNNVTSAMKCDYYTPTD